MQAPARITDKDFLKTKNHTIMTNQKLIIAFAGLCVFLYLGCGGCSQEGKTEEAAGQAESREEGGGSGEPQNLQEAMEEVQKALEGAGEAKEVVDFRELKALLPESLAGLSRTSHTGEKAGAMGFKMSTASAEYREGDKEMDVAIVDFAGVGAAMAGVAAWATVEVDRETEEGYERTTMIEGYKGYEKYDRKNKSGQASVIVGSRFIVTVEGRNVSEKELSEAIGRLELKKLAGME